MKVVYGHTDSIYVQVDTVEKAQGAIEHINNEVRKKFPNVLGLDEHPVVLEFEKFYSSLGVGITKNRNAGLVSWQDGVWLDEPKFAMTGFSAKKISETKFAKGIQQEVLRMWVEQKSFDEINSHLQKKYNDALTGNVEFESLIKRRRFNIEKFMLKCPCKKQMSAFKLNNGDDLIQGLYCSKCGEPRTSFTTRDGKKPTYSEGNAAIMFSIQNGLLGEDIDSYVFLKVEPVGFYTHPITGKKIEGHYVARRTYDDLREYTPNYAHYAEQVLKKAKPVYDAMGWDTLKIKNKKQTLEEWF